MNEQLNAAKDQAAREFNMDVSMFETPYPEYLNMKIFNQIINRAMEIYAEMVNGWVSVSERLPELNQFVLADYGYKIPIMFCYKGDGNWLALDAEIWVTDDGIKQWMPLPNKPIKTTKP